MINREPNGEISVGAPGSEARRQCSAGDTGKALTKEERQELVEEFIRAARKCIRQGGTEADFQAADRILHQIEGRSK